MQDERCAQIDGVFGVRRALAAFRSLSLNEKRRQVAALQRLPPFQVKWLIAFSFNLHSFHLNEL
jgi:hypothetical protein